ncbi:MAG TPA: DNA mismatch repair protein MutS [Clostridiales bacterium]|nr:DNA mismatch repair protein MutS [Clostridiales bacterium]
MTKETPMMQQYRKIKKEHPEALLFLRMGDFYEMFCDDAKLAAAELDLVLTAKSAGSEGKVPMCGVPHHAVESYIARLIDKGYRVAICEQLEDPKLAKGLVKRDVVRIISPGTVLESALLPDSQSNYLATVFPSGNDWGFCYTDISTGEFKVTEFIGKDTEDKNRIFDEIYRVQPKELLLGDKLAKDVQFRQRLKKVFEGLVTLIPEEDFSKEGTDQVLAEHFNLNDSEELFLSEQAKRAAGATLSFLYRTQKRSLSYIGKISYYKNDRYMILDQSTRKNLELTSTIFTNQKKGSLLWVIDRTSGTMGKRLLREWLENPLLDLTEIQKRQAGVKELYEQPLLLDEIKTVFADIRDLERLSSRIAYGSGTPRDIAALRDSIKNLPAFQKLLYTLNSAIFREMAENFDDLSDIDTVIRTALVDDPPISPKEGGMVKAGYHDEIDEYRRLAKGGKRMILDIEAKEREATGIKTLKVGYNRVFGYYIEVSNSFKNQVPDHYIRKQTLTNGERFFTQELKEYEDKVLGATDQLYQLEYEVFCKIRDFISANTARIQLISTFIAITDVVMSFATVALENQYCCPVMDDGDTIEIKNGRHPMVEKVNSEVFIANDTLLDSRENRIMVITGPNMAGKSTYMRQVALIILLAQIGSFVPAETAHIGLTDRIFTRIGASDDLVGGNSTFMVEMRETAAILKQATDKSFIILDEIGRGTSTFDGLALAWACIEYLADAICAPKTLFATHYHELTSLEEEKENLKNYAILVHEVNGNLVFLRKITRGKADKSYGIQVAKLAGMPVSIVNKAKKILKNLEKSKLHYGGSSESTAAEVSLFREISDGEEDVLKQIAGLDLDDLRPLDALRLLEEWQDYLKHE